MKVNKLAMVTLLLGSVGLQAHVYTISNMVTRQKVDRNGNPMFKTEKKNIDGKIVEVSDNEIPIMEFAPIRVKLYGTGFPGAARNMIQDDGYQEIPGEGSYSFRWQAGATGQTGAVSENERCYWKQQLSSTINSEKNAIKRHYDAVLIRNKKTALNVAQRELKRLESSLARVGKRMKSRRNRLQSDVNSQRSKVDELKNDIRNLERERDQKVANVSTTKCILRAGYCIDEIKVSTQRPDGSWTGFLSAPLEIVEDQWFGKLSTAIQQTTEKGAALIGQVVDDATGGKYNAKETAKLVGEVSKPIMKLIESTMCKKKEIMIAVSDEGLVSLVTGK